VTSGGNVGIGTTTPGATLHVNGTLKLSGGSPGLGKVLTSNATGSATWELPVPMGPKTAAASGNWSTCVVNSRGNIITTGSGSGGNCTINFAPAFGANPVCTCSVHGNGSCGINTVSMNNVIITQYDNGGTTNIAASTMFHLICLGM
jgi:uncharacterized Zn-binding protein involved in type VI secretion